MIYLSITWWFSGSLRQITRVAMSVIIDDTWRAWPDFFGSIGPWFMSKPMMWWIRFGIASGKLFFTFCELEHYLIEISWFSQDNERWWCSSSQRVSKNPEGSTQTPRSKVFEGRFANLSLCFRTSDEDRATSNGWRRRILQWQDPPCI